jgi:multidrug efflux pump subunit AcrB
VLLFKDFLHPVTILVALPLSLGGAFVGLLLAGKSFSMPSLIGLIMLMGIATKNSILLVEYAIVARRGTPLPDGLPGAAAGLPQGSAAPLRGRELHEVSERGGWLIAPMSRLDALLDACHKRARPIVMTTIAMGAGMVPIAFSWGSADGSFRSPMAVAVIGGLITSTLLSLLVVPAVYTYIDDLESGLARLFRRKSKPEAKPDTEPELGLKEPPLKAPAL